MLMLFKKNLNIVIDTVNQLSEIVNNIDTNFEDIYLKLDKLNKDLTDFENQITNYVNVQIQNNYNQVVQLMNDYQTLFNNELQTLQNDIEAQILDIELGNVVAYNPTNGSYENISTVILDVYDALRNNAISCAEFDALELSATEFDALQITAYNFDVNGKDVLNVA